MARRKLRIVKAGSPMIGICERCNTQFKADSADVVATEFITHQCRQMDTSQNALRIVREATENK